MAGNSIRNDSGAQARLEMEESAKAAINTIAEEERNRNGKTEMKGYRIRSQLYDKIHVSLRTMDIIIVLASLGIVVAIVVGIIIGQ